MSHDLGIELDRARHRVPTDQRQLLCVSGGGVRGLYTALVLEELEQRAGRPLCDVFDVLAGTSIGAWIATALALRIPATDIRAAITAHGPTIFERGPGIGRYRLPIINPLRLLYRPRYAKRAVQQAIDAMFGEHGLTPLSGVRAPLVLSTVDVATSTPVILLSGGLAGQNASNLSLRDALLATSAAPTYFPVHHVGDRSFVDGGLVANAPDLVAVTETIRHLGCDLEDIRVLSVGTAGSPHTATINTKAPGLLAWLLRHGVVQLTLSAQEQLAVQQTAVLLRERYLRLDYCHEGTRRLDLRLDAVSEASIDALKRAAEATIDTFSATNRAPVRRFLSHRSQGPRRAPLSRDGH